MLTTTQLVGFGAEPRSPFLLDIIQELGLTSNLNLVLDAADLRSYDGSSQTWTDATGQGNNFFRGADGSATATDPTFNGTAGLATEATYFSFDGGDYFTETAAHTFADGWHKNNGAFSIVAVFYFPNLATTSAMFSNGPNAADMDGIALIIDNTEAVSLFHSITTTTNQSLALGTATVSSWNYISAGLDESTTAWVGQVNATPSSGTATASTDTDNNSQPLRIGAFGDATSPVESTSRLACFAGWSTNIGDRALLDIYNRLKARRFPSLP